MQVEMRTSEQRGQKKDPEALHRSRGGEEGRHCIMDYDYHGHFGNLQEVWQSCWHQKCTGLSVMYQKNRCLSGVHGFWSYCHTSYIFLQVQADQQWLMNFKMLKSFVEDFLELHFIWQCAGFWMSLLDEQNYDCSAWVTVHTAFP